MFVCLYFGFVTRLHLTRYYVVKKKKKYSALVIHKSIKTDVYMFFHMATLSNAIGILGKCNSTMKVGQYRLNSQNPHKVWSVEPNRTKLRCELEENHSQLLPASSVVHQVRDTHTVPTLVQSRLM